MHTSSITSTKIIPGAEPFFLPQSGPVGVLLIHGFTSTPYDTRACGEYLARQGITVSGVLVAGHGTSPKDLAQTNLDDWLNSVKDAYDELKKTTPIIFALGISLAGNYLITLSKELEFAGLILVGMPLKFRKEKTYRTLYYAYRALGINYQRKWYQSSLDPDIRALRPNYRSIPLSCAPEVFRAIKLSQENLKFVNCPILAIQSTTDHAVDEETIKELSSGVKTKDVEVRWVKDRYHVVLIDHGKEEVFEDIRKFIEKHSPYKP